MKYFRHKQWVRLFSALLLVAVLATPAMACEMDNIQGQEITTGLDDSPESCHSTGQDAEKDSGNSEKQCPQCLSNCMSQATTAITQPSRLVSGFNSHFWIADNSKSFIPARSDRHFKPPTQNPAI